MPKKADEPTPLAVKISRPLYLAAYTLIAVLFGLCGLALSVFAVLELLRGTLPNGATGVRERFGAVLEAVGMLTVAVAALELSQTVIEEEVQREAAMSAPTRVRRFLSRFLVLIVVALATEALVVTFRLVHEDPTRLPPAAAIAVGAAALLAAWGVFIRLNKSVETLEPEAMARAKEEDRKLQE
jgi:hypothetical protein